MIRTTKEDHLRMDLEICHPKETTIYTSGQPHELVKSCIHMPPSTGYAKAKQMLQDYFGDDYKIAEAYLKEAMDWQAIKPEDGAALQSFALFLTGCSNTMADISYMEDLDNAASIKALASKLPYKLKESWRKYACDLQEKTKKRVKFKDFVEFVNKQVKYLIHPLYGNIKDNTTTNTKDPVRQKPKVQDKNMAKSKKVFTTYVASSAENKDKKENESSTFNKTKPVDANGKPCFYCSGEHHSFSVCKGFSKKPHKEKIEFLKSKGLCFACLKHGHMSSSCSEKAQCQECARPHPTLLHITFKESKDETKKDKEGTDEQAVANAHNQASEICSVTGAGKEDCFLSIVPVQVKAQKGTKIVTTYAFLDPGSSATFATESLINELNLNGRRTSISLRTMGNEAVVNTRIVTGLEISNLEGDQFIEVSEVFSQKAIPVTKDNIPRQEDVGRWPHLKEVKLPAVEAEVGLLIGANIPKALEPLQVVNSIDEGPYAVRTVLGWTVNGPLKGGNDGLRIRSAVTANRISVAKLEEHWHQQFKLDFPDAGLSEDIEMSKEDHQFMNMVSQSAQLKDGHYSICLPLRNKSLCMPNNRSVAEQRALNLRKRFTKDADYRAEYVAFMEDIVKKGYAVQIGRAECAATEGRTWYLPHHGVRHPVKRKLRVVFDCAASFGGTSLNQHLLQGPDLTSSLVGVLTRFRQESIAVMADVEAMFYQVAVQEEDTNLLRFLWWPEGNHQKELAEFKMKVHIFGATSSPSVATYAMQKCAADFEDEFGQEAAITVKKNFYVDDCLKSVADEDTAVALCSNLRGMLARGGFRLTKWASNSRKLLNSILEGERAQGFQDLDLNMDSLPMERALGIQWCAETDQFKIKINLKERPHTRRGLLSFLSSIFDPLGFIAPVILPAKRILQDLCRQRYSWDDSLPVEVIKEWTKWTSDLQQLEVFGVDRCIKSEAFGTPVFAQLHHFADASEDAYGTTSYLVLRSSAGETQSSLMMAKARVAPLKYPTIPRMELTAASVAVKMDRLLKKELELELHDSVYWTDSTVVLKYLNNESSRFKTFVANRVSTILQNSQASQWRYVNTRLNPADHVSRGLTVEAFLKCESWLSGPEFLCSEEDQWPKNPDHGMISVDDPEVKRVQSHATHVQNLKDPLDQLMLYYSSWVNLKRAVAWYLKLKDLLKELNANKNREPSLSSKERMDRFKKDYKTSKLICEDLTKAETEIMKYAQRKGFQEDLKMLKEQERVKKSSTLRKLNPVLLEGLIRVGGRLSRAALPDDCKKQVILPKDSHVTRLILRHIHDVTAHAGRNHMLSKLQRRFWIPGANGAIRRLLSKCVDCKKLHRTAGKQLMADLPTCRVLPDEPPFTRVGVDYFGPFMVKRGRGHVKRYGVIFTCLAVRAVHLEVASSLDTDACLNAIRRFLARRGQVKEMYSDNGTNFRAAESEMRKMICEWNTSKIEKHLQQKGVQWHFNPPTGSHHGGTWERLIRSVRKILNTTVKEQMMDEESLHTLLCEAEAIMNSRPITKASSDINDLEALTPNHLLLLKVKPELPPGVFSKDDQYTNRRWRQVQYLADIFWKRWCREYLMQLQERQRWSTLERNFSVGDVVLVIDDTSPRNSWPLGRITETLPDRRGFVRQVKVKTRTNELLRPVTKLVLLQESEAD
ncbi:uncharacterized protein V3H82_015431 [Fundulus diaphanus]